MPRWQENYAAAGGRRSIEEYARPAGGRLTIGQAVRKNIVFAHHNLAYDASFNCFHLIVSRGITGQYNTAAQWRVHDVLFQSLIRLGFLALSPEESIRLTPHEESYGPYEPSARIFRRTR